MRQHDANVNYAANNRPFGGWGESGIGVLHGAQRIRKYCKTHSLLVTRLAPKNDINTFPYSPRTTKLLERCDGAAAPARREVAPGH